MVQLRYVGQLVFAGIHLCVQHEHNQHHGNHIHDHHPHKSVIKHNGSKRDDESVLTVESEDQELLAQRLPRIYESLKVEEHPPLSVTGYNQLLEDLKSYDSIFAWILAQ